MFYESLKYLLENLSCILSKILIFLFQTFWQNDELRNPSNLCENKSEIFVSISNLFINYN